MADTFKGIVTADGKKRQLPYRNILDIPISDPSLTVDGGFADAAVVGKKNKKTDEAIASLKEEYVGLQEATAIVTTEESIEDIYSNLKIETGKYVDLKGNSDSNAIYKCTNPIRVKTGDILKPGSSSFRFVTAYSNGIAVPSKGVEEIQEYVVPDGIDEVIISMHLNVTSVNFVRKKNVYSGKYDTVINDIKEDISEITETTEEKIVLEEYPTKSSGYYWAGAQSNSSYFYVHLDVAVGDVITISLSNSSGSLMEYRFIDAYKGTERISDACVNDTSKTYTVPDGVDNIYISVNFREDEYDYYVFKISRIVRNKTAKGIKELADKVTSLEGKITVDKKNYTLKFASKNIDSGKKIELCQHIDNKKNKSYRFTCRLSEFNSVTIGQGYNVYSGSWITVDNINVTSYYYNGSQAVQMGKYAHGLTISDFIDVIINVGDVNDIRATIVIMSKDGDFTHSDIPMGGCNGSVFAFGTQAMMDVTYSYAMNDLKHDAWLFGDSYISLGDPNRWTHQLMSYGYTNLFMCGFGGATSSDELISFREVTQIAKPKEIIWALGMNDADTENSINTAWKSAYDEISTWCDKNNVELILCTIPNTPKVRNIEKNIFIRDSGRRYVDFAKSVNAEKVGASWYDGMLSSDKVHPLALGAKALANRFLIDVPEVIN